MLRRELIDRRDESGEEADAHDDEPYLGDAQQDVEPQPRADEHVGNHDIDHHRRHEVGDAAQHAGIEEVVVPRGLGLRHDLRDEGDDHPTANQADEVTEQENCHEPEHAVEGGSGVFAHEVAFRAQPLVEGAKHIFIHKATNFLQRYRAIDNGQLTMDN